MMTALVTGGAGFIGSHLVERLLRDGARVRVLDDFSTGRRENLAAVRQRVDLIEGSLLDPAAVKRAVDGCECIFHLAGLASVQLSLEQPLLCHEVNATGTLRLLETSRQAGAARFIYAGSSSAYGNPQRPTCGEGERAQALSAYAAAKLAGELYVEAYARTFGMKTVRLRFFNVYGPRQQADSPYSGVISRFIRLLQQGERPTIYGDGLQTRDFVYVSDVVEALCLASRYARLEGQVYNVGSGRSTNLLELLDALAGIAARAIEPIFAATRSGDVRASRADIHLATSELGFAPKISLPAGLKLTWNSLAEGCGA